MPSDGMKNTLAQVISAKDKMHATPRLLTAGGMAQSPSPPSGEGRGEGRMPRIERPTSNVERPTSNCSMLDVGCSMFDVRIFDLTMALLSSIRDTATSAPRRETRSLNAVLQRLEQLLDRLPGR